MPLFLLPFKIYIRLHFYTLVYLFPIIFIFLLHYLVSAYHFVPSTYITTHTLIIFVIDVIISINYTLHHYYLAHFIQFTLIISCLILTFPFIPVFFNFSNYHSYLMKTFLVEIKWILAKSRPNINTSLVVDLKKS